ncbi:MAG: hypothetical protein CMH52_08740 [Myxococcales bacterium]|nr:hypothetical protein [Myxococcales bacterium]|tara:strand:+ start:428 stop:1033 length:606 start_codon:yes stop_codon:yes gene_type:complete
MRFLFLGLVLGFGLLGCETAQGDDEVAESTPKATKASKLKKPVAQTEKQPDDKGDDKPDTPVDNQDDAESLLVGIWKIDVNSIKADDSIRKLSKVDQFAAMKAKKQAMAHVAYEFADDGRMNIYLGGDSAQRGTYTLKVAETPDPDRPNLLFVEASTVGPIGSKTHRWKVTVNSKSLKLDSVDDGESLRLFRGMPSIKAPQ